MENEAPNSMNLITCKKKKIGFHRVLKTENNNENNESKNKKRKIK